MPGTVSPSVLHQDPCFQAYVAVRKGWLFFLPSPFWYALCVAYHTKSYSVCASYHAKYNKYCCSYVMLWFLVVYITIFLLLFYIILSRVQQKPSQPLVHPSPTFPSLYNHMGVLLHSSSSSYSCALCRMLPVFFVYHLHIVGIYLLLVAAKVFPVLWLFWFGNHMGKARPLPCRVSGVWVKHIYGKPRL